MISLAALALAACLAAPDQLPAVAIIIDDLGNQPRNDHAALALPGPLNYAVLPFVTRSRDVAEAAHAAGNEVLLHLPMEATAHNQLLGPGALRATMAYDEFVTAVRRALDAVPHLVGLNNHMGSLLTTDRQRMDWLMEALAGRKQLIFVDSRTTSHSAIAAAARDASVPYLARDVFLDNRRDAAYINARFDDLVQQAQLRGAALGIAHPYPETLAVLRQRLRRLRRVRLVALSELRALSECRAVKAASIAAAAEREQSGETTQPADYPYAER